MAGVVTATVEADEAGMRVDRWFREHYPALPFGRLQKLLARFTWPRLNLRWQSL